MHKLETPPGDLGQLVEELRQLDNERLLWAWKCNSEAIKGRRRAQSADQPLFRHYAFRFVAIERFGVAEHIARYREIAATS